MKMKERELTNEGLTKLFKDNFELAVSAIRLAQSEVQAGHDVNLQKVLAEIKLHPEHFHSKKQTSHYTESY